MPAVELRPYQRDLVNNIRDALRRTKHVLAQLPTGGGKTALASDMVGTALGRGRRVLFIVHRKELVEQTSKTFARYDIGHSFIANGREYDPDALIQICSIDTLKSRMAKGLVLNPDLVVWDECHHIAAAGWTKTFQAFPNAYHVGLSATPVRTDGSGLDSHFGEMVIGPSVAWLMEQGYLSPYRLFAPPGPSMAGVKKSMGDYAVADLVDVMDKPKLTGDIVEHWLKHCGEAGTRTGGFAVNVQHSKHLAAAFIAAGIPAAHVDGDTPAEERAALVQQFAAGEIRVLWCVDLIGEGFDLSAIAGTDVTIDAVILARPTQSLRIFLQQIGRALRPAPGKTAIILDHAGNTLRHGLPDDERSWSLQGTQKTLRDLEEQGPPPPLTCDTCFCQIRRPAPPICPCCGNPIVPKAVPLPLPSKAELQEITRAAREAERLAKAESRAASKLAREIEEARQKEEKAAAKLAKAEAKAIKDAEEKAAREAAAVIRKAEEYACKDIDELTALGRARGYPAPRHWAEVWFATRKTYKPSRRGL